MLARLWWKEYRVFGPVWLILLAAAGLLQWLFLSVDSADAKAGGLTVSAVAWAVLYAFAAGAAAFAGERESKTLGFLDALPVGRGMLWLGKASFALVTAYGLALALAAMAALWTETRDPNEQYAYPELARVFGTVLFEAVAWSLFWSSVSKNALIAGVLGVLSVYLSAAVLTLLPGMDYQFARNDFVPLQSVPARLAAASAALAISGLVMAWRPARRRAGRPRVEPEATSIRLRVSSTGRSLAWQASREGWTTWVLAALIGLGLPIFSMVLDGPSDGLMWGVLGCLAYLVAGVNVFGMENASGARRFLVQHGVAPGTVWWRKVLVWGLVMGAIFGLSLLAAWGLRIIPGGTGPDGLTAVLVVTLVLVNAFAVGLLSGMAIPRRMTAAMVGLIGLVVVVPLQGAALVNGMVPAWTVFLVPLIFVAVSRAWAGDWLLEREGARPWIRLGAWLVVPFGLLAGGYLAYRGYGVPDVGPQFVAANLQGAAIPPGRDAAESYRQAFALVAPEPSMFNADRGTRDPSVDAVIENGWDPAQADVIAFWKKNQPAIDLARKATAMPQGRFEDLGRLTVAYWSTTNYQGVRVLGELLALDARERLSRADLPGAWDDILAQFRMAGQLGANSPPLARMQLASTVHHRAVGLGFAWLGTPGQAPETLKRALADLKALPPVPNLAATMQAEASFIERSLDLPDEELADMLLVTPSGRKPSSSEFLWFTRMVAPAWERQRTRRVGRLLIARELPEVVVEPYQRGRNPELEALRETDYWQNNWNLSRRIVPYFAPDIQKLDREVVGRRALEQAVAIVTWKLDHDGQYPEKLDLLVPGLLARLPFDPYSGKPFGYVQSIGRPVLSAMLFDTSPQVPRLISTKPGQRLIYSVGPDLTDDAGRSYFDPRQMVGSDFVFPIP